MTAPSHFETVQNLIDRYNAYKPFPIESRHNPLASDLLFNVLMEKGMTSKLLAKHLLLATSFLVVTFSLGFFIHDEEVASSWRLVKPRTPAMMRVNPAVFGPKARSNAEKIASGDVLLGVDERALEKFSLVTDASDFSRGVDARSVNPVESRGIDYSKILPASLSPVANGEDVAAQIFDHSVSSFFNQDHIRNTSIGRAAKSVEETMKAEVALGGDEPDSTQHNLKFQMKATQTKASMEYRGITNAELSYSVASRSTDLEIFEPLGENSRLVYHHSARPDEKRDVLSLRLNF